MNKMNIEWKKKWVKALRSGEYKQGRTKLRSLDDKFCCLGVLCNLVDPLGWIKSSPYDDIYFFKYDNIDSCNVLPETLKRKLEMPLSIFRLSWPLQINPITELVHQNDAGDSFELIADWIEENL